MKYVVDNGMIDLSAIEQQIYMNKKIELVKKKHNQKVWLGKDGRWRTYVIGEDNKRIMKVKKSENDLYDYLFDYYTLEEERSKNTFEKIFYKFKEYKKKIVVDNTIVKYESDYNRFFKGTNFSQMEIEKITEEDISVFFVEQIKKLHLRKKAYEALFGYVKSTLKYARNKRYINENPCDYLERRNFYKYCESVKIDPQKRIVTSADKKKIMGRINQDKENKPNYIVPYAVELASMTGMRVGEISALMWEAVDFSNHVIIVDKAEVFSQRKKTYSIEKTKNGIIRTIPMTKEVEKLLLELKKVEVKYGYLCEFVFANENGQIHKTAITRCASNKSFQAGLDCSKPIHSYRRTINSVLKADGISTTVAASILGHSERVNDEFYTYDTTDMNYKRKALEKAINS